MWLKNCWYVIAWEHEIPAAGLLARTVLEEPIVVFRSDAGIVALEDRCSHRAAPLSAGRVEDGALRCLYHGLKFDGAGQCLHVPGAARPPSRLNVRAYPVAVHNRWVFVWMGDPARADRALLPNNFSCGDPAWVYRPGYIHYDTPYLLICDNLLDFSHLAFVHEKTLGGDTRIAEAKPAIEDVPRGVRVSRHVPDTPPPPYYRRFRTFTGNLDRWFIYDFVLPGTLLMHSGGRPTGETGDDNAVLLHSCQTLTPETATSTHYFFQQAHRADLGDAGVTERIHQSLLVAFDEDRAIITAQYRNMLRFAGREPVALPMDAALTRFRAVLDGTLAAERAG